MAVSCSVSVRVCVFILVKENITFVTAVKPVPSLLLPLQDRLSIAILVQAVRAETNLNRRAPSTGYTTPMTGGSLKHRRRHGAPAASRRQVTHLIDFARVQMHVHKEQWRAPNVDPEIILWPGQRALARRKVEKDNPPFHHGAVMQTRIVVHHACHVLMP